MTNLVLSGLGGGVALKIDFFKTARPLPCSRLGTYIHRNKFARGLESLFRSRPRLTEWRCKPPGRDLASRKGVIGATFDNFHNCARNHLANRIVAIDQNSKTREHRHDPKTVIGPIPALFP